MRIKVFCLFAALAASPASIVGQNWTNVDQFQLVAGIDASAGDVGSVPGVGVCAVGSGDMDASGTRVAIVRGSADSGVTWTTLDQWLPEGWFGAHYRSFCSSPDGYLYAGGEVFSDNTSTTTKNWIIRRSVDGGVTWTTQDVVDSGSGGKPSCGDMKVSPVGHIYACGVNAANQGYGGWAWLVRKSSDAGQTWDTVDTVITAGFSEARAIAFATNGSIYVAGYLANVWTVRRSTDAGLTWSTIDSYKNKDLRSEAQGIAIDASGNIFVAGKARGLTKGNYTDQWVVRRSSDGGKTWSLSDNLTLSTTSALQVLSGPTGLTVLPSGALVTCGHMTAPDGSSRWLVRQGTPGTRGSVVWGTIDNSQLSEAQPARPNAITVDSLGKVFVSGRAADATGASFWLTRRLF